MADIAFMLLIFFLTSVQFRNIAPPPIIVADLHYVTDPKTSVHILHCSPDHHVLIIGDGDTTSVSHHALADSATKWVCRERRTVVVLRSESDIQARIPLGVISLLQDVGVAGVVLGELER